MECNYYPDEENPHGCIVGFAMRNLGFPIDDPSYGLILAPAAIASVLGVDPDEADDAVITGPLMDWVLSVQENQDLGLSWSESVEGADDL
jgi:hypothetical protein